MLVTMDLSAGTKWTPPETWLHLTVIDSHAGGEPFRLVVDGLPAIPGEDVLARRRFAQTKLDWLRKALTWEPRGHADMYGGWLGPPTRPDSDLSVLFLHNSGFSTMCGHGIIALTKVVIDTGIVEAVEPETTLRIDTPAGQVTATTGVSAGSAREVSFRNVESFVVDLDANVEVDGLGAVSYDLAFGGAFYAYVNAPSLGIDLSDAASMVSAGRSIKSAISGARRIDHPDSSELGFLYGVVFTGPPVDPVHHHRSVCVFADGEVDRSPTGTGVSGSLAILHDKGQLSVGEAISVESIVGSVFSGRVVEEVGLGGIAAVIPEVSGTAYIIGRTEVWIDPSDPLAGGFLIR